MKKKGKVNYLNIILVLCFVIYITSSAFFVVFGDARGDGKRGERIAKILAEIDINKKLMQKKNSY